MLSLLKKEFPHLAFVHLKGYNVTYSKNKRWLPLKILWQAPKILRSIINEHRWLQKIVQSEKIDAVISDNRYGLWSAKVPCIFITHQLRIKAPYPWLESLIQKINYRFIRKYTTCWVPDVEGMPNIAADLSHPRVLPGIPTHYLGVLTRFEKSMIPVEMEYDWLILLSGPEPQRSILEEKLYRHVQSIKGNVLLVRGKPQQQMQERNNLPNCKVINHLSGNELALAYEKSRFVISRSGYTTVMEILLLGKKALLIPTPGQTEQEYLAAHLKSQHWCNSCLQEEDLANAMKQTMHFNYQLPAIGSSKLPEIVGSFIAHNLQNK